MAQQTAVDYIIGSLRQLAFNENTHLGIGDVRVTQGLIDELEKRGKQIEKGQILNARLDGFKGSAEGWNGEYPGWDDKETSIKINNEQYYNETYGGQGSPDTSPNTQNK